jgi:branched-chain amino acid transport system ATP-binding protein
VTDAIEINDLHVTIAGSHVLQGVSLIVPTGGVTAILGRNGVGKTTTLRAILGLVASSGQIQGARSRGCGLADAPNRAARDWLRARRP